MRLAQPDTTVIDFLHDGGFPAPLGTPDGDRIRRAYFNDIVERDVRKRVGARSTAPLRQLAQMLFESAGSELSVRHRRALDAFYEEHSRSAEAVFVSARSFDHG